MQKNWLLLLLMSTLFFYFHKGRSAELPTNKISISAAINNITYQKYPQYLHKDICSSFPDFSTEQIDRPLFDLFLMCLAFQTQGVQLKMTFVPTSNYLRAIRMVQEGAVHTSSSAIWSNDINHDDLYATTEVLRIGESEKGIYTHELHPLLKMPLSSVDLGKYVGITFKSWVHDWAIISALTDKKRQIGHLPSLFKILQTQRGDFTLMDFPSAHSLSIAQDNITLKPINGIKVTIPDSRRIIISKQAKDSKKIFSLLNQGLLTLREQGKIRSLYEQAGFINTKTKNWIILDLPYAANK